MARTTKHNDHNQHADAGVWTEGPALSAQRLVWLGGLFAWLLLAAALLSYSATDRFGHTSVTVGATDITASVTNWIGGLGAFVSSELFEMLGIGTWVIAAGAAIWLGVAGWKGPVSHAAVRALGLVTLALAVSGAHATALPEVSQRPEGAGGLLMIALTDALTTHMGVLGTWLTLAFMATLGAWVAFDRYLFLVPKHAATATARALAAIGISAFSGAQRVAQGVGAARTPARENDIDDDQRLNRVETFMKTVAKRGEVQTINESAGGIGGANNFDPDEEPADTDDEQWEYEDADDQQGEWDDEEEAPGAPQVFDRDALREKVAALPIRFASADKKQATQEDLDILRAQRKSEEEADRLYQFPGLDILEDPEENFNEELEQWVRDQAEALEEALQTYRVDGEVVGIESGPVITLYRVRLAPGTKVSQITQVSSDIARMLKAVNIRVVPNEAGTDTVGVEVPNLKKEKVRLKELMTNSAAAGKMKLPMFLGKDASGNPLVTDLASLPHILIAGTTGSGKSVCMNAIITGFLYTQKPSDMKLVLVDPKMVELSQFKDIPHLMCPVVTEMAKAAAILEWAVTKMDERYELLAEAGVRDISAYNSLEWEELLERFEPSNELEEAKIPRKLPYMVFVIDELADLMMTNKEVEGSIVRIAQKARAVGIHLILATQRPQANVVTGLIKSNMPGRVAFKVASGMDSRIVLDQKGGELLLGHGDMLLLTPRSGTTIRAQGTLVDDAEIRRVVKFVRDVSGPTYERDLAAIDSHGLGGDDGTPAYTAEEYEERMRKSAQEDPLFDRAVEIVLETKRGSVSLLQRRLAIGYTRASRLIELMGMSGIIGKHKGSVAREVIMTIEEWEALKQFAAEEASTSEEDPSLFNDEDDDPTDTTDDPQSLADIQPELLDTTTAPDSAQPDPATPTTDPTAPLTNPPSPSPEAPPFDADDAASIAEQTRVTVTATEPDTTNVPPTETPEDTATEPPTHDPDLEPEPDAEPEDALEESDDDSEDAYVYVDEDGNEIPADELDDDEWEYEESWEEDDEEKDDETDETDANTTRS